jgi:hypothetical protein
MDHVRRETAIDINPLQSLIGRIERRFPVLCSFRVVRGLVVRHAYNT